MKKNKYSSQSGFTITELSLSMAMLSVLLIIILVSVFHIISVYNKGLTLKRVNQSGRVISHDLQADLRRVTVGSGDVALQGSSLAVRTKQLNGEDVVTAICTGYNTYIWNVWGNKYGTPTNTGEKYDSSDELITMVKVSDSGGAYCKPPYPQPKKVDSKEMLGDDLAIRQPLYLDTGWSDRLMTFTFTISTPDANAVIQDVTGRSPCEGGSEADFCALNTFVVTTYAKGI